MTVVWASTKASVPTPRMGSVRAGLGEWRAVSMEALIDEPKWLTALFGRQPSAKRSRSLRYLERMPPAPDPPTAPRRRPQPRAPDRGGRRAPSARRGSGASVNAHRAPTRASNVATLYRHFPTKEDLRRRGARRAARAARARRAIAALDGRRRRRAAARFIHEAVAPAAPPPRPGRRRSPAATRRIRGARAAARAGDRRSSSRSSSARTRRGAARGLRRRRRAASRCGWSPPCPTRPRSPCAAGPAATPTSCWAASGPAERPRPAFGRPRAAPR